jgi:hypothetical protein
MTSCENHSGINGSEAEFFSKWVLLSLVDYSITAPYSSMTDPWGV